LEILKFEFRAVIKFLCKEGHAAKEIHDRLCYWGRNVGSPLGPGEQSRVDAVDTCFISSSKEVHNSTVRRLTAQLPDGQMSFGVDVSRSKMTL